MFTKDSRELYFVVTEKLQRLQNSSANLIILGILANFRRYFFPFFFSAKSNVLIISLESTVTRKITSGWI